MINLLPPASQKTINYARRNSLLLKACLVTVAITIGIVLVVGLGHFYLASTTSKFEKDISELQASLKEQGIDEVKQDIQDLSGNVKLALQVLSREILFSKMLRQVGAVMPSGSTLAGLEISDDQKGIDITANVENYQVGTQIQVNLADPDNKIFDKVDLVSVECTGAIDTRGGYPCQAKLRALLGDNSSYLFINNKPGSN